MSDYYHFKEVVDNLWLEYRKTLEYRNSPDKLVAIRQNHPIIVRREEEGLKIIISTIEKNLGDERTLYLEKLASRRPSEWIAEWLKYHKILFSRVLKDCGKYRSKDVWFDTLEASENDYKIPSHRLVPARMSELVYEVCHLVSNVGNNPENQLRTMAKIHFEFIRIHPFADGNGRIGRLIIDQLSLAFSFPTVMGGYPRANLKQRLAYHKAIKACCFDTECTQLTQWIRSKLDIVTKELM